MDRTLDEPADVEAAQSVLRRIFPHPVRTAAASVQQPDGAAFAQELALVSGAAPRRRLEFVAGRVCARQALQALGVAPSPLLRAADRTPIWPSDVVGSISHAGDLAAAAVAKANQNLLLGLDVERRWGASKDLTSEICRSDEHQVLARLDALTGGDGLTLLFSAKEAAFKAHFGRHRRMFGFEAARMSFDEANAAFSAEIDPDGAGGASVVLRGRYAFDGRWTYCGVCCGG